ncbi:FAD-dependent oxidoreductase [Rhodococcus sp. SRB_17]|nr:FAD-dependent oxidoreductase [Rhodococcus sp. SRB_17]
MVSALVVGSGPNGLAAAITLAAAGVDVQVAEAADTIGGGLRSEELTVPGLIHDHCAAIVPTAVSSPFIQSLDLAAHGVEWAWPEIDMVHPLDNGEAGVLQRSIDATAAGFGSDERQWHATFDWLVRNYDMLADDLLSPMIGMPHSPLRMARFGPAALLPATLYAKRFHTPQARALFAGNAAHGWTPLSRPPTTGVALMFAMISHRHGWPVVVGGTDQLAEGLARVLESHGGRIATGTKIDSAEQVTGFDLVLYDTSPRQVLRLIGDRMPGRIKRAYERFRHGAAAFKLDIAVHGGIPWTSEHARSAGTVHVCGSYNEVVTAENDTARGRMPQRPFMIVGQQAVADPTRAAGDLQPIYMYAHVPHGYTGDATESMLTQVERFAPGFRDRIAMIVAHTPADIEADNANNIGGDINGGAMNLLQFIGRPRFAFDPYWTGVSGHYLCSASTPPGGGVHGMCGHLAARSALHLAGLA